MKILWVTKMYSPNNTGGTKVSFNYIQELTKNNDVYIHSFKSDQKPNLPLVKYYSTLFKLANKDFDIVFFDDHFSFQSVFFFKKKTISFYHGNWPDLLFSDTTYFLKGLYLFPLYLIGMRFTKLTVFVNPYFERKFKKICRNTITVLNPINTSDIDINKYSKPDALASGYIKIVLVGNVDNRKYSNFVKFLQWLQEHNIDLKAKFYIYGALNDSDLVAELKSYHVTLMGFQKGINYNLYDFNISFSKAENLPLTLLEALNSSVTCIYPDSPNYIDFKSKRGILLYKDFDEIIEFIQYGKVSIIDNDFIPKSYKTNLERILDYNYEI